MTIYEMFLKTVKRYPDNTFLISNAERISYSEINNKVLSFGNYLHEYGIKKGDRVCFILENSVDYIVCFFSVMMLGGIAIPIDPRTQNEIKTFVNDSESKMIIAESNRKAFLHENIHDMPSVQSVLIRYTNEEDTDADEQNIFGSLKKTLNFRKDIQYDEVKIVDEDLAFYIYTSGTVKNPKGVMLTNQCLTFNVNELNGVLKANVDDVFFNVLPFYHCYGICTNLLLPASIGASVVLHSGYSLSDIRNGIIKYNATVLSCVPLMFEKMQKVIDDDMKKNVKKYISSGASLPFDLVKQYKEKFDIDIINAYGSSETNTIAVNSNCYNSKPGSVGILLPSLQAKIVNGNGDIVENGIEGEIVLKTPKLMLGYHNMKSETKRVLKDGWYYTGDLGYITNDRELFITGRKKAMFNVAGKKVFKEDVESTLLSSGYFAEVYVYAKEDYLRGEKIIAKVILKVKGITEEQILKYCREHMAPHKIPKEIIFCNEIKKVTWKEDITC